jgi:hypothetical protein
VVTRTQCTWDTLFYCVKQKRVVPTVINLAALSKGDLGQCFRKVDIFLSYRLSEHRDRECWVQQHWREKYTYFVELNNN